MIDAYEIGIQLLLQDDVTAGLAIINRELAEVDRAINATSAHLATLVAESNRAAKAVATAMANGSTRLPASEPTADNAAASATGAAQSKVGVKSDPAPQPTVAQQENTSAPIEKSSAPAEVRAPPPVTQKADQGSGFPRTPSTPTAPSRESPDRLTMSQREAVTDDKMSQPRSTEQRQVTPTTRSPVEATHNQENRGPAVVAPRPALRLGSHVAMTASVRNLQADRNAAQPSASSPYHVHSAQRAHQERTFAPLADIRSPDGAKTTAAAGVWERATAPTSPARDGTGGGGGTVMLDGRLVGQWLADHLARQASRPPGGTSFFDPRQTPAWTVSGAL